MTNEQAVEARWPAVLELLGRQRKVTALLRDARVAAVQANDVTLEFDYAFPAEQIEKPENRLVTEKALQRVFGRPLRLRTVVKLDWADVEAWAKSKPERYPNRFDGYNIDCPVHTHEPPSQRLSVWAREDGSVVLNCFGKCEDGDVLVAVNEAINSDLPDTEGRRARPGT